MNTADANRLTQSTSRPHLGEHLDLFGPPPLFEGEDPKAYDEFLTRISTAVKPVDIIEDIWVRDFVDLTFDVFRLRRLKANVMMANAYERLERNFGCFVAWRSKPRRCTAFAPPFAIGQQSAPISPMRFARQHLQEQGRSRLPARRLVRQAPEADGGMIGLLRGPQVRQERAARVRIGFSRRGAGRPTVARTFSIHIQPDLARVASLSPPAA
jgi:hypothetical protein